MSFRIALVVEGSTETNFMPAIRRFLEKHLAGEMPKLVPIRQGGRVPTGAALKRLVDNLMYSGYDHVIALTDVYTGTKEFADAADAIYKMRAWVGNAATFHPHAAQHDVEAWLLPYWSKIQARAGSSRNVPSGFPETLNHDRPPSVRIREVYDNGSYGRKYKKPSEAEKILEGEDLCASVQACPQLKALMNTIVHTICGKPIIP